MDAREILGIPLNAGEEEIRAAYLQKVKEHPPDRSPEQFEKIRDAYEALREPRRRMRDMLLSAEPEASLASLIAGQANERRFAGPQPWLDVLKEKKGSGIPVTAHQPTTDAMLINASTAIQVVIPTAISR